MTKDEFPDAKFKVRDKYEFVSKLDKENKLTTDYRLNDFELRKSSFNYKSKAVNRSYPA